MGRGLQASRDTCFLLSGPKWNPDKNTPLVAACLWVAATGDSKSSFVCIINVTESYRKGRVGMARFGISKKIALDPQVTQKNPLSKSFCTALIGGGDSFH